MIQQLIWYCQIMVIKNIPSYSSTSYQVGYRYAGPQLTSISERRPEYLDQQSDQKHFSHSLLQQIAAHWPAVLSCRQHYNTYMDCSPCLQSIVNDLHCQNNLYHKYLWCWQQHILHAPADVLPLEQPRIQWVLLRKMNNLRTRSNNFLTEKAVAD